MLFGALTVVRSQPDDSWVDDTIAKAAAEIRTTSSSIDEDYEAPGRVIDENEG